jgi:hypothetical protein
MKGFIYIASAFHTVNHSKCGRGGSWIDNDPHFWTSPPTWGICRNDLRKRADPGDYIFFVLPRHCRHPQMIFGYLRIAEPKITHAAAYHRTNLKSKRMGNKNPNGKIWWTHAAITAGSTTMHTRGSFLALKENTQSAILLTHDCSMTTQFGLSRLTLSQHFHRLSEFQSYRSAAVRHHHAKGACNKCSTGQSSSGIAQQRAE